MRPASQTVVDLKLPPGSTCVDLAAGKNFLLALFEIPNEGLRTLLIDENHKVTEVKPTPECFASDIPYHDKFWGRQKLFDEFSFSSFSDPTVFDVE